MSITQNPKWQTDELRAKECSKAKYLDVDMDDIMRVSPDDVPTYNGGKINSDG